MNAKRIEKFCTALLLALTCGIPLAGGGAWAQETPSIRITVQVPATRPLELTYPSEAGVTMETGASGTVRWNSSAPLTSKTRLKMELLDDAGHTWLLSSKVPNKGQWTWQVGKWSSTTQEVYPDGDTYRIRISTLDDAWQDESDTPFAVSRVESVEVAGLAAVEENAVTQYTCTASYFFGAPQEVTANAKWSLSSKCAKIGNGKSAGILTAKSVLEDQPCRIVVTYGKRTNAVEGFKDITIANVP